MRSPLPLMLTMAVGALGVCLAFAEEPATRPAINAYCPVMPEDKVNPTVTYVHQGETIGFCCEQCLAKFKANPDQYKAQLASSNESHAHAHGGEAPSGHKHPEAAAVTGDHEHAGCCQGQSEGFFAGLIAGFGKFHPPAVSFPIAMIIGAAVAEVLLMATGRPFFGIAGRFCIWFGALGGVVAAMLGWFLGGFELVDASWVLATHRWLGTTTAAWAVVALFLGERVVRREQGSRRAYRVALLLGVMLVATTGFFGGSLHHGLYYYLL